MLKAVQRGTSLLAIAIVFRICIAHPEAHWELMQGAQNTLEEYSLEFYESQYSIPPSEAETHIIESFSRFNDVKMIDPVCVTYDLSDGFQSENFILYRDENNRVFQIDKAGNIKQLN